jgi:hypothetical protein
MKKPINDTCWVEAPAKIWNIINDMQDNGCGSITVAGLPDAIERAKAAGVGWVYYDVENIWPDACAEDLKDPLASIKEAGRLIREAGLKPMQASYWDKLVIKRKLPYPKEVEWTEWWKTQARAGDAVDIQLPGYPQNTSQQFGEMTQRAVATIKKANPNVEWILINMIEYMSDDKQGLERAWQAAKPHVQGRWVWK